MATNTLNIMCGMEVWIWLEFMHFCSLLKVKGTKFGFCETFSLTFKINIFLRSQATYVDINNPKRSIHDLDDGASGVQ